MDTLWPPRACAATYAYGWGVQEKELNSLPVFAQINK